MTNPAAKFEIELDDDVHLPMFEQLETWASRLTGSAEAATPYKSARAFSA